MNKTFHWIKKDLRISAGWLMLWTLLCIAHFGLRMYQLRFGDTLIEGGFWGKLETSERWDWQALRWLPLLIIPFFMHADPLVKRYAFWKSLPIHRWRLVTAKLLIVMVLFILFPMVLEVFYARSSGLSSIMGEVLGAWALRFLPLVLVVTLACYITPSMLWGLPLSAMLMFVLNQTLLEPRSSSGEVPAWKFPELTGPLAGSRIVVDGNSGVAEASTESRMDPVTRKFSRHEITQLGVKVRVESLPEGVLIGSASCRFDTLELSDRTLSLNLGNTANGSDMGSPSLPVQETSRQMNSSGLYERGGPSFVWQSLESAPFSARSIPATGGILKGRASALLVRRVLVKEMEIVSTDRWIDGLQRLSIQHNPRSSAFSFESQFYQPAPFPLSIYALSDRLGTMAAPRECVTWLVHKSRPLVRLVSSPKAQQLRLDVTRSRALTGQSWQFEQRDLLPVMAPLASLRFMEEQSDMENWKIECVRYEPVGRVEIPFSVRVQRPQSLPVLPEDRAIEELGELPPSFESQLAGVRLPGKATEEDVRESMISLTELCLNRRDLARHDAVILPLLENMAMAQPEVLFEEVRRAADRIGKPRSASTSISFPYGNVEFRNGGEEVALWKQRVTGLNDYWGRVIRVLIDQSKPDQKELFLKYHSQLIDLMDAIFLHGWEQDALPLMQGIALREPVPLGWLLFLNQYPSPRTTEALIAQIRMGAFEFYRVLDMIDSGLVDGTAAANAAWDTTVEQAVRIADVREAFLLAVKYGVESAPRDLVRIVRSGMLNGEDGSANKWNQRFLLSMLQALAVRSDCPVKLAEGMEWLEENAFQLVWNPQSRRYEKSGAASGTPWVNPPEGLGDWVDPFGVGSFRMEGKDLVMTSQALDTYCDFLISQRSIVRMMKTVVGDFTAEVTVDFPFVPSASWNDRDDGIARNAGLIVEEGRPNFQRIFRGFRGRGAQAEIIEQIRRVENEWTPRLHNDSWDPSKPVRFKLCRHGEWFYSAWKQGDGPWVESEAQYNAGWGPKTRVGPYLCNKMIQPMEARFSDYTLTAGSEAPARAVMANFKTPGIIATPNGTDLGKWGAVRNPVGAGEFKAVGDTLTIRSAPRFGAWRIDGRIGAPAALQKVRGNFTYEVTVGPAPLGEWSSAVAVLCSPSKTQSYKVGNGTREKGKLWLNQLLWSRSYNLGTRSPQQPIDHSKPLRLKFQREGRLLQVLSRQENDSDWQLLLRHVCVQWPDELEVGVAAVNGGPDESVMTFENPVLIQNEPQATR